METLEESKTTKKPKWDQALPFDIHAVLEEFDDVFPQELGTSSSVPGASIQD